MRRRRDPDTLRFAALKGKATYLCSEYETYNNLNITDQDKVDSLPYYHIVFEKFRFTYLPEVSSYNSYKKSI